MSANQTVSFLSTMIYGAVYTMMARRLYVKRHVQKFVMPPSLGDRFDWPDDMSLDLKEYNLLS